MARHGPYEIDCKKSLLQKGTYFFIADGRPLKQGEVPSGLEGIVDFPRFVRSFSEGAAIVVLEVPQKSDCVYRLESDQVRGDYRLLLYKLV